MKKLHLTLIFSLAVLAASSQKVYFFYIQTESSQPFYVKLDKKIQYSSPNGYIILPKLYDSSYTFSIGFPQNKWPEQNFAVSVNKKDHGYLLKSFPDKGWGLFDLQSMELMMAMSDQQKKPETGAVTPFTELLSKAADDPSLKEKVVLPKAEEKKPEESVVVTEPVKLETAPVQTGTSVAENDKSSRKTKRKAREENKEVTVVEPSPPQVAVNEEDDKAAKRAAKKAKKDAEAEKQIKAEQIPMVATDPPVKEELKKEVKEEVKPVTKEESKPVANEEPKTVIKEEEKSLSREENYKKSEVKRYAESSTTEGFGLVFVDQHSNGNTDTIRLVIPNPKPAINTIPEAPKEDKKFLEINTGPETKPAIEKPKEDKNPENKTVAKTSYPNGCSEAASESDVSKLNRRMKTVNDSEEKMLAEAKKYFKTTCFSSVQVKELGSQFINDEAKYNFFDLAYKYVIDPEHYGELQSEIKDTYYNSRFKAMLRN